MPAGSSFLVAPSASEIPVATTHSAAELAFPASAVACVAFDGVGRGGSGRQQGTGDDDGYFLHFIVFVWSLLGQIIKFGELRPLASQPLRVAQVFLSNPVHTVSIGVDQISDFVENESEVTASEIYCNPLTLHGIDPC